MRAIGFLYSSWCLRYEEVQCRLLTCWNFCRKQQWWQCGGSQMNWAISAGCRPCSGPFRLISSSNSFLEHCQPQLHSLPSNMLCPYAQVWPCQQLFCAAFTCVCVLLGSNWAGSSLAYARLEHRPVVRFLDCWFV